MTNTTERLKNNPFITFLNIVMPAEAGIQYPA